MWKICYGRKNGVFLTHDGVNWIYVFCLRISFIWVINKLGCTRINGICDEDFFFSVYLLLSLDLWDLIEIWCREVIVRYPCCMFERIRWNAISSKEKDFFSKCNSRFQFKNIQKTTYTYPLISFDFVFVRCIFSDQPKLQFIINKIQSKLYVRSIICFVLHFEWFQILKEPC